MLYTLFPVRGPTHHSNSKICFGHKLGITMEKKGSSSWFSRELKITKLMKLYSIAIPTVSHIDNKTALVTIVYDLLSYIIPRKLRGNEIYQIFDSTGIMVNIV